MSLVQPLKMLRRDGAGVAQFPVFDSAANEWVPNGWLEYAEDLGVETNTTTTYTTKLSLITSGDQPAGVYFVTFAHSWAITSGGSSVDIQYRLDTTEEYFLRQYSPVGVGNNPRVSSTLEFTLTAGTHTFDIRYRRDLGAGNAEMGDSTIHARWIRR